MTSNVTAIIQARMSSTRFPGKVTKLLSGTPMFAYQVNRVKKSKRLDKIVVATSNHSSDDEISHICKINGIECFRGDLKNVLKRYYDTALKYNADIIVRLTADCPLSDPNIIDDAVTLFINNNVDYVSNVQERSYPDGLDVEVFSFNVLEQIYHKSETTKDTEHVTSYIINHPEKFKQGCLHHCENLAHFRLTVDFPEDIYLIRKILNHFQNNEDITYINVLSYLKENPNLSEINAHHALY